MNGESHIINQHFHENGEKQQRGTAVAASVLQEGSEGGTSHSRGGSSITDSADCKRIKCRKWMQPLWMRNMHGFMPKQLQWRL
jgi:hypothetical protein